MNIHIFLIIATLCTNFELFSAPLPLSFSIPESKILRTIPEKELDFAPLIPGNLETYIYDKEEDYYKDYQRSYFAITYKKAGWDCMRHYEILANGCIPYFIDLDTCDPDTMHLLPRKLILEAMNLDGVSYLKIDHEKFDRDKYFEILTKLLEYTREHLSTKSMARYLLKAINYSGDGNILFLSPDPKPDYLRCLTLTGLKELYGEKVVDAPKITHLYETYESVQGLYGRGMSYTKNLPDLQVNRDNIEERIMNKEFDLIVYGSIHRGTPYLELVERLYEPEKVVFICGEDRHVCPYTLLPNFFLREFESIP